MPRDSVLCSKYINTSGVICSNLQNYIQIEVLGYILEEVAKSNQPSKVVILLQIMAHCSTFFKPTKENEQVILNTFVQPLLELSKNKVAKRLVKTGNHLENCFPVILMIF